MNIYIFKSQYVHFGLVAFSATHSPVITFLHILLIISIPEVVDEIESGCDSVNNYVIPQIIVWT